MTTDPRIARLYENLPPAPDVVDAEAELLGIEDTLGQLNQTVVNAQQESNRLVGRAQFLQGVLARSRTHDIADVTIESDGPG